MYRLIASDMDGTLCDSLGNVTHRTRAALEKCLRAGALFSLSSGRMPEAMYAMAAQLGVNAPMIMFNGALIQNAQTGKILYKQAIPVETARAICSKAEQMGVYIQAYPGKGYFCHRRTPLTLQYQQRIHVPAQETGTPLSMWLREDCVKLLAIAPTPEEAIQAEAELRVSFSGSVSICRSVPTYIEIVANNINKGQALLELAAILKIRPEETLALGDGNNDIPMLQAAGAGYAMGGSAAAEANGINVIPPLAEDGVAIILEQLLEQGLIGR